MYCSLPASRTTQHLALHHPSKLSGPVGKNPPKLSCSVLMYSCCCLCRQDILCFYDSQLCILSQSRYSPQSSLHSHCVLSSRLYVYHCGLSFTMYVMTVESGHGCTCYYNPSMLLHPWILLKEKYCAFEHLF